MDLIVLGAFAFLAGLTASGLAASLLELAMRSEVRFAAPFISASRFLRSIAVTLLAGPFMLGNDALAAQRGGRISRSTLGLCGIAAAFWLVAMGLVLLALASGAGYLLA